MDRENGQHNVFCSTILPNVITPCQSLTVDGNRWIIFPQRSQCCLCCTSQHGCGILAPDWLKGADYQGEVIIDGNAFDKWHEKGSPTLIQDHSQKTTSTQPQMRSHSLEDLIREVHRSLTTIWQLWKKFLSLIVYSLSQATVTWLSQATVHSHQLAGCSDKNKRRVCS